MRTSLTRLEIIEEYLSGEMDAENQTVFQAQAVLDNELASAVKSQEVAYHIITLYSRQSLKSELEIIHHRLQKDSRLSRFWNDIHKIFQKN